MVELSAGFDLLVESNDQPRAAVFAQPRPPVGPPSLAASPPGGRTTALAPTLVGGTAVSAQAGSIRGSVVDRTGLVLPGVIVTLRGDGIPRTAYSDEQGTFELAGVAPGTYTLRVSLAGFSDATVENVTVSGAPLALPPVELQLASFGDTVVVTASRNEDRLIGVEGFQKRFTKVGHGLALGEAGENTAGSTRLRAAAVQSSTSTNPSGCRRPDRRVAGTAPATPARVDARRPCASRIAPGRIRRQTAVGLGRRCPRATTAPRRRTRHRTTFTPASNERTAPPAHPRSEPRARLPAPRAPP